MCCDCCGMRLEWILAVHTPLLREEATAPFFNVCACHIRKKHTADRLESFEYQDKRLIDRIDRSISRFVFTFLPPACSYVSFETANS